MSDAYPTRAEHYGRSLMQALSALGEPDPHVLAARIEEGPPFWPASRAYQWIRRPGAAVLVTAGLGHPWEEPGRPGYGYELVLEVGDAHIRDPWVFGVLARAAEWSIRSGSDLLSMLEEAETPSFETSGAGLPDDWRSHTGRVGLLFGLPIPDCPTTFDTTDGPVRLVAVTLLHPRELATILADPAARDAIAAELAARPLGHATSLDRPLTAAALPQCAPYVPPEPVEPEPSKSWWKFW